MAGGQALDLAAAGRKLDLAELELMHIHKTGALIRASVLLAAQSVVGLDAKRLTALDHYAKCVGLAFQIQDDILDVEGETATLGKKAGADSARNKPTYPSILGLTESKQRAAELRDQAVSALAPLGEDAAPLKWLAEYIVSREN
jgi:farnesyl diphosphate synthase